MIVYIYFWSCIYSSMKERKKRTKFHVKICKSFYLFNTFLFRIGFYLLLFHFIYWNLMQKSINSKISPSQYNRMVIRLNFYEIFSLQAKYTIFRRFNWRLFDTNIHTKRNRILSMLLGGKWHNVRNKTWNNRINHKLDYLCWLSE